MAQLDKLETTLDDVLHKKAPVQLPADARNWIARNLWWISLVTGLCLLWSALTLWQAGHTIDRFAQIYATWAGSPLIHHLGVAYYLSLLAIGATGVVSLLAASGLKDMRRSGWQYLYYAFLFQILAGVFLLFSSYGGGFSRFIGTLISAAVGGYFLFQVRDHFTNNPVAVGHYTDVPHFDDTKEDTIEEKQPKEKPAGHKKPTAKEGLSDEDEPATEAKPKK